MVSIDFMYTCIPGYNVGQLTTVGRDMAKHHDLLGARLSHTVPPTIHSSASIKSATEIAKMGCTCTVGTTEEQVGFWEPLTTETTQKNCQPFICSACTDAYNVICKPLGFVFVSLQ